MSTLLAINCGTQMLEVRDTYDMSTIEQAMRDGRSIEVVVRVFGYAEDRIVKIDGLHLAKDGWGAEHIEGTMVEDDGTVQVTLYDNPAEADPLNLR